MNTGFSEVNIQPHRGRVRAAPGRLLVQSVCVLVHTGWPGGVAGGWVYLWSGLWPCPLHLLETLVEFPPLQLHCGVLPPMPGVVNPPEHGARKLNVVNVAPSCHAESCKSEPWRRAAPCLRRPFSPVTTSRSAPSAYHDTASRLLPFLPHSVRRTHNTSRVPLPGCLLRTRLRPRTPPPLLPSPPPLVLCSPLGVLVRVLHHHIPLHCQSCPCPPPRTCTSLLPSSPPLVRHIPSSPSSTSADPLRPPPRIPSARPSARPWPPALSAPHSCPCPALRVATVLSFPLQQLSQHLNPGLLPLLLGTVQAHPRQRRPQHPPPPPLFHLRPSLPGPPRPADQVGVCGREGPAQASMPVRRRKPKWDTSNATPQPQSEVDKAPNPVAAARLLPHPGTREETNCKALSARHGQ